MTIVSAPAAAEAPLLALACPKAAAPHGLADAARLLLPHLERGQRIDAVALRDAMERAFGGSDAAGAWDWKTAYDACEAATVLFLRKFGPAIRARAASPAAHCRCSARSRLFCPRIRADPRRARHCSSSRRRSSSPSLPPRRPRSDRPTRARALGRDRVARHLRRACGRPARLERACRGSRWAAEPALSRRLGHAARRRSHPRPSRWGAAARASC